MIRRNQSPVAPVLSPIKSEGDINKGILNQLFSRQFLGCLKDQLSSKLKDTKHIDTQYQRTLFELKTYKREIQKMRIKIKQLTNTNEALQKQLYQIEHCRNHEIQPVITISPPLKIVKNFTIVSFSIFNTSLQSCKWSDQIFKLQEKVQKLQIAKSIKDQRLNQMLEKSMRIDSEVKLLRIKNEELQEEIKSLRQTVILGRDPDIAVSYHFNTDSPHKNKQQFLQFCEINHNLQASFTNNVEIPSSLELSKAYLKRNLDLNLNKQSKEFNQIDYIIAEELPYLSVSNRTVENASVNPSSNLNESVVQIDLNRV